MTCFRPLVASPSRRSRSTRLLLLAALLLSFAAAPGETAADPGATGAAAASPPTPAPTPGPAATVYPAGWGTTAGSTGVAVRAGLEAFAQYALQWTTGAEWFHRFDLSRAHAALEASYQGFRGRFVLEGVRSTSEGALLGVATDSELFRVREAYAAYRYRSWLEIRAGVVPTLTIPTLEAAWGLRAVNPIGLEVSGLASPADLGGSLRVNLPGGYGAVSLGGYNGEGYTGRELNRGKNLEVALELHPLPGGALDPLALFSSFVRGSTGTASARADRLTAALLWTGRRVRGGATFTFGWGLEDNGLRRTALVEAFVQAEPVPRLLLGLWLSHWLRDADSDGDTITVVTGAAGWRLSRVLQLFLAGGRALAGERALQAVPGSDFWDLRVITRVVF